LIFASLSGTVVVGAAVVAPVPVVVGLAVVVVVAPVQPARTVNSMPRHKIAARIFFVFIDLPPYVVWLRVGSLSHPVMPELIQNWVGTDPCMQVSL
jgi:hypothetical protein